MKLSNRLKFELLCFVVALLTLNLPNLVEVLLTPDLEYLWLYTLLAAVATYYGLFRLLAYLKDNNYFEGRD